MPAMRVRTARRIWFLVIGHLKLPVRQQGHLFAVEETGREQFARPVVVNKKGLSAISDIKDRAGCPVLLGRPAAILVKNQLALVGLSFRKGELQIPIERTLNDRFVWNV
jgi:hypothetical protein